MWGTIATRRRRKRCFIDVEECLSLVFRELPQAAPQCGPAVVILHRGPAVVFLHRGPAVVILHRGPAVEYY
jgi:hypothetical protein